MNMFSLEILEHLKLKVLRVLSIESIKTGEFVNDNNINNNINTIDMNTTNTIDINSTTNLHVKLLQERINSLLVLKQLNPFEQEHEQIRILNEVKNTH